MPRHAALLALLIPLACGRGEDAGRAERRLTAERPASPEGASAAEAALPGRGEFEVSFGAGGIVARANQAPRRRVLEALARETDLVIVAFVEGGDPDGAVTLDSEGEPIEVVLARALSGVPFSVEPLDAEGRARLAVVVGKGASAARAASAARLAAPSRLLDPRVQAERVQRANQLEGDALAQLESPDPRDRVEGVEWADLASVTGYEAVLERLANDPDASVRAAAAESLGSADVGAVRPLLSALTDPEPSVVVSALDSLEMLADASILPELAPALEHPDASVRERAKEVIEFLE